MKDGYSLLAAVMLLVMPQWCFGATAITLSEGIEKPDPAIGAYLHRVALDNDDSAEASVYVSALLYGDIDGDKLDDAFIAFAVEGIGGGNFSLLFQALFLQRAGRFVLAAEREDGSFGLATGSSFVPSSIEYGKITGEVLQYAEDDGACCPSIRTKAALVPEGDTFLERYGKETEKSICDR